MKIPDRNQDIGIIPEKDIDSPNRTLFLKIFFRITGPLTLLFLVVLGIKGLLISFVICLFAAWIVYFIVDKLSDVIKILFGARAAIITVREQMEGSLKAVKVSKMNKDYPKALEMVNSILKKDPEFYEAMLVKAQILNEGYNNAGNAKKYLKRIIDNEKKGSYVHTWASSYAENVE